MLLQDSFKTRGKFSFSLISRSYGIKSAYSINLKDGNNAFYQNNSKKTDHIFGPGFNRSRSGAKCEVPVKLKFENYFWPLMLN
jgi:hypothetical protein